MIFRTLVVVFPLAFGMILCVGCGDGGAAVTKRRSDLKVLGMAYHGFHMAQQRSPSETAELVEYIRSKEEPSQRDIDAIASLEEGDIVMNWNATLGEAEENGKYVLGFEARAPASGGYVVMGDGFVELMTGKDFSEASMIPSAGQ